MRKEKIEYLLKLHNHSLEIFELINNNQDGINIFSTQMDLSANTSSIQDIGQICSITGLLFEKICNNLSYRLPISVTRRKNDKYTIGDLWPQIKKTLKNSELATLSNKIDHFIYLRNMLGSHYNEWAQNVSREEVINFKNLTHELCQSVYCVSCSSWIEEVRIGNNKSNKWSCRCGKIIIHKKTQENL